MIADVRYWPFDDAGILFACQNRAEAKIPGRKPINLRKSLLARYECQNHQLIAAKYHPTNEITISGGNYFDIGSDPCARTMRRVAD